MPAAIHNPASTNKTFCLYGRCSLALIGSGVLQALTAAEVEAAADTTRSGLILPTSSNVSASKQVASASAQQAVQARAVADATDAAAAVALQNAAAAALAKKQSHRKLN